MGIKRINEFPEGSGSLSSDDIFLFMDNPSGSGITKKITLSEINNTLSVGISSNTGLVPNSTTINNIVGISQVHYDALTTKDSGTLYVITTPTPTPSITPTVTPSISVTPTVTPSISVTPTRTSTNTPTPSITPSISISPTVTSTPTTTPSPSWYMER